MRVIAMMLLGLLATGCSSEASPSTDTAGHGAPPARTLPLAQYDRALLLGEGWLSGPRNEYNLSLDAAARLMVFARSDADFKNSRIWFAHREGRGWSEPARAPFSDPRYRDSDPWLTRDGATLYFVSDRPVSGEAPNGSLDIWRVSIGKQGFGTPEHLAAVASAGEELGPELHGDWLYFNSSRKDGPARLSIYRARVTGRVVAAPEAMPAPFNAGTVQGDFTLSPDGRVAMFWSKRDGSEELDLFASCRKGTNWSAAVRLPPPVSGKGMDFTPSFSADGRTLFFASMRTDDAGASPAGVLNGQSNLYSVPAAMVSTALARRLPAGECDH